MGRLIDAYDVVTAILAERDKIPATVPAAPYELGMSEPFRYGSAMRGGIRKALRCIEMSPTVDAVPVARCKDCKYGDTTVDGKYFCLHPEGLDDIGKNDFCSHGQREENQNV